MDFGQFYQDGGVFMHVITLLTIITGAGLLRRCGAFRKSVGDSREMLARIGTTGAVAPSMLAAIVMVGMLGTSLGWVSVHSALETIPPEHWQLSSSRGGKIALYPLVWSLLCAIPLTVGHGVVRRFEQRLRSLAETHAQTHAP